MKRSIVRSSRIRVAIATAIGAGALIGGLGLGATAAGAQPLAIDAHPVGGPVQGGTTPCIPHQGGTDPSDQGPGRPNPNHPEYCY